MKVIRPDGAEVDVTEKAYDTIYKDLGYMIVTKIEIGNEIDYDKITVKELMALLDEKGIEYDKKEKKAELWAKLEELVEETTNEDELELDELIVEEEDDEETGE